MIHFKPYTEPYEFLLINKPLGKSISFKTGETIKAEVIDILPNGGIIARIKDSHVAIKTEIPLQKDTTLLLRVMDSASTDKKLKLQLINIFKRNVKILNLEESLKNIDIKQNSDILIKLVEESQNNKEAVFRFLMDKGLIDELKNINKNVQNVITELNNMKNIDAQSLDRLKSIFVDISKLTSKNLEEMIRNSGLLYESKVKKLNTHKNYKEIEDDLKNILLNIQDKIDEKKVKEDIQNILNQIESFQLLSKTIGGLYTFLPLIWDSLKSGHFAVKKSDEKKQYLCKITLDFDQIGLIDSTLFLYKKDLKIDFKIENDLFKRAIQKNIDFLISELKKDDFSNIFVSFSNNDSKDLKELLSFKSLIDIKV